MSAPTRHRVPTDRPVDRWSPPALHWSQVRGVRCRSDLDLRVPFLCRDNPVVVVDRISLAGSAKAYLQAVDGLFGAVEDLAEEGLDLRPVLARLSKSELVRRMKHESETRTTPQLNGGPYIVNSSLAVTDFLDDGVLFVLSTGSSRKIDEKLGVPVVTWLAEEVILRYRPAVLFCREYSRLVRDDLNASPIIRALQSLHGDLGVPSFAGQGGHRLLPADSDEFVDELMKAARRGEHEVRQLQKRSAAGARQRTTGRMEQFRVLYGTHVTAPPGLATAKVQPGAFDRADAARAEASSTSPPPTSPRPPGAYAPTPRPSGAVPADTVGWRHQGSWGGDAESHQFRPVRYLFIDSPASRPDPDRVISARTLFTRADGTPAIDQAAIVETFLGRFGGPGWSYGQAGPWLIEQGYSSEALRIQGRSPHTQWGQSRNAGATGGPPSRAWRTACDSILQRLDDYHTGTFTFGMPAGGTVTVENVLPPSGRWMTDADFDRIQRHLGTTPPVTAPYAYVFTGLAVTVDGQPAQLDATVRDGALRYAYARTGTRRAQRVGGRHSPLPPLPHSELVASIANALASADPLPQMSLHVTDELTAARQSVHHLTRQAAMLQRKRQLQVQAMADGLFEPEVLPDMQRHHKVILKELRDVTATLRRAEDALARLTPVGPLGVADQHLLELVRALADPRSAAARQWMAGNLSLAIRPRRIVEAGVPYWDVTLTGRLAVHDGSTSFALPIQHRFSTGPARRIPAQCMAGVEGLRRGIPLRDTLGADWRRWLPAIRECLHLGPAQFRFATCDDPRLLRLAMAVWHPPCSPDLTDPNRPRLAGPPLTSEGELAALAQKLGEPLALLTRIREAYRQDGDRVRWREDNQGVLADAYAGGPALRRRHLHYGRFAVDWYLEHGRRRLRPCDTCGPEQIETRQRLPLQLRETTASVCQLCRRDRAGVHWPETYDRYRHKPSPTAT